MADDKPIIVIKKKGGHGGHHGGAWKVAYADFVTAMMAFFMVMWLLNSADVQTRKAIASYFRKPGIFDTASTKPIEGQGVGILPDSYSPPRPPRDNYKQKWEIRSRIPTLQEEIEQELRKTKENQGLSKEKPEENVDLKALLGSSKWERTKEKAVGAQPIEAPVENKSPENPYVFNIPKNSGSEIEKLAEKIQKQIDATAEFKKLLGEVEVKADADGLTIEIMDTDKSSMFASGSAVILPAAREAFTKLTQILMPLPNTFEIIGHTDAKPYSSKKDGYSNWDLSTSRANEARKVLLSAGLEEVRIKSIVGKAETDLRKPEDPFAAANRRITLKMKFDLTRKIDLGQDPEGIQKAQDDVEKMKSEGILPQTSPTPNGGEKEPVHSLTTNEVLEGKKKEEEKSENKEKETPEDTPSPESDEHKKNKKKDLLFDTNPIIGPKDIFSDL